MAARSLLFFLCLNDRGGAELSMLKIACGLAARGQSVTLAVYGAMPHLAREAGFAGRVIELGARRTVAAIAPLRRLLREETFDVVFSALTQTNLAALIAAWWAGRGTPVVVSEHGLDDVQRCARNPLYAGVMSFLYARAAAVTAVSAALAAAWQNVLRRAVVVLHNPVVDDVVTVAPPPHAWLADKSVPVIMAVGRLKVEKDFATLLRAFARVVAHRPARLIVLGEGPERAALTDLAARLGVASNILMPGFVSDPAPWLAHADLLACSSLREGFGNVLVEAMAQGVPVVSTDCPFGPREILKDGALGRLTPVGDAELFARALAESLETPVNRGVLRARAADFSTARCIDACLSLVDTVCSAMRSGRL